MTEQFQIAWDLRTPCGCYYTYKTNKETGREELVKTKTKKD